MTKSNRSIFCLNIFKQIIIFLLWLYGFWSVKHKMVTIETDPKHWWICLIDWLPRCLQISRKLKSTDEFELTQSFTARCRTHAYRASRISGIRQMKPDIRPNTGYQKRPDIRYNPNTKCMCLIALFFGFLLFYSLSVGGLLRLNAKDFEKHLVFLFITKWASSEIQIRVL